MANAFVAVTWAYAFIKMKFRGLWALEDVLEYRCGSILAELDRGERVLVERISFSVARGQSMALIGETGSGKTMTALSLMRLLPSNVRMIGDEIRFMGRPLPQDMRPLLGVDMVYIPQNGLECLNPSRKVRHHLYDNLKKLGMPKKKWAAEALEKLRIVGLKEPEAVLDYYPFQLSGGMAQRVSLAISACSRAKLVIADEPTNGLEQQAKTAFSGLLRELFPDAAVIVITHDIEVASFCDSILVLCGGRAMESGRSNEVLEKPRQPYTKALLAALVKNGMAETPVLRTAPEVREPEACPFYRRCAVAREECLSKMNAHAEGDRKWWCNL